MTTPSTRQWPTYAPINLKFDKTRLFDEIKQSGILSDIKVATTHSVEGKSFWDNGVNFKSDKFLKQDRVPLWNGEGENKILNKQDINTFFQVNITTPDPTQNDLTDSWIGQHNDKSKKPLWIVNNHPWTYRTDYNLSYLKSIVDRLSLEYVSMIRIVYQQPPSIGVIHRDSGPVTNSEYYNNGGVTITLNVSSGGANLYFIDSQGNEHTIDEANTPVWHFDDGKIHCTNEVTSDRIQIRIYGKHTDYQTLMLLDQRID